MVESGMFSMAAISLGLNAIILSHVPSFVEKKLFSSLLNIVVVPFLGCLSGLIVVVHGLWFSYRCLSHRQAASFCGGLTMREAMIREVHKEGFGGDKVSFKHPASHAGLKFLI